jgi:hypothetical protein
LRILERRFGAEAQSIHQRLDSIEDDARLEELGELAGTCPDLESFQSQLAP